MNTEIGAYVSSFREWAGNVHFMKQLEDIPVFPVEVFHLTVDGARELVRVEH
jgi:hypothetical protein